ncbi:hypothetical protein K502DRAFT_323523 [Neoconidiobolus thromboides FSU 785]|nr:hypothetical protein K502DRAFT_323523 [Neoconidiobolus thromboides FSU 785]
MSRDHTLNFISVLLTHFEDLNVVKNGICPPKGRLPPIVTDEIELFLSSVLPLVMAYISEAPLVIVNGLLSILMEKNNVVAISRSKVGLAFLTIFLTRIEVLRQSGGSFIGMMAPSPEVPLARSSELFSNLFNSLQNHFLAIFPSLMSQIDDLYAWQFLASLSVGLNLDQQHTLVLELRDKVIEQITLASRGHLPSDVAATKITNVNLFLHALGLDASQVNV